jgi:hypothetical protein
MEPWADAPSPAGDRLRALVSAALEFGTWQALARRGGLSDADAAETMLRAVQGTAAE